MANPGNGRRLAVVTGASSGIGLELAKQFAGNGFDLAIVAEDEGIERIAPEIARETRVSIEAIRNDLRRQEEVDAFYSRVRKLGRPVEAIALNAGVGASGDFARQTELQDELDLVDLNVRSTVHLAKLASGEMVARGAGRLLFTASIAGLMPAPLEAVYGASKAFVLAFADSLRHELRDTGVTVTTLIPGPTDTNFFHRAGMDDTREGADDPRKNSPADVAKQGFEALMAGKDRVLAATSLSTKLQGALAKVLPDEANAEIRRKMAERGSANCK